MTFSALSFCFLSPSLPSLLIFAKICRSVIVALARVVSQFANLGHCPVALSVIVDCLFLFLDQIRIAVVAGSNKGIGLETLKQIATQGVKVVLTARDEKRGLEATSMLHNIGLTNVDFHQLDVLDPVSVDLLAKLIKEIFGRLHILVNNAGKKYRS